MALLMGIILFTNSIKQNSTIVVVALTAADQIVFIIGPTFRASFVPNTKAKHTHKSHTLFLITANL